MKLVIYTLTVAVVIQVLSCSSERTTDDNSETIDIESNISNMKEANLSSFCESLRYIPLETVDNMLLSGISSIKIFKDLIIVHDRSNCLVYDSKGHFITRIGTKGTGPGEYKYIDNLGIGFDPDLRIYLSSLYDIYEYNTDGTFINRYSNRLRINDSVAVSRWEIINDSLFFGHLPNNTGNNRLKALIMNKYGEVLHGYGNYIFFTRDFKHSTSSSDIFAHFNRFRNTFFYKDYFNDTLFMLNNQSELVARYAFDFGRYKFPVSERAKIQNWKFTMSDYIFIWEVFQTDDYLFINCDFKNHFPAKRLTPKTILPGMVSMGNTSNALGIFNKKDKSLFFCKPTDTDNPLFTSGLFNDIDDGPRFFPKWQVNDSVMIMWVSAKELKDHITSDDFKKGEAKHPEKKKKLERLANSLSEFDNPVLMLVTFRK